jgi:ATP-dependent DNA helicase DinG
LRCRAIRWSPRASDYIDEQGGSSFYEYSVPQAIISLKQGLGRLIRSTTDRGVLAVLDPRLNTKAYGRTLSQKPAAVPDNFRNRRVGERVFEDQVPSLKFQVSGSGTCV